MSQSERSSDNDVVISTTEVHFYWYGSQVSVYILNLVLIAATIATIYKTYLTVEQYLPWARDGYCNCFHNNLSEFTELCNAVKD